MLDFNFYSPTEMVFGKGAEAKLGEYTKKYGGSKVLLVYGSERVVKSGLMATAEKSLAEAGIESCRIGGVVANPRLSLVREGIKLALEFGADFIVGVGGGSVIDTAKAIAHGTANPEYDIWDDIWCGKVKLEKSLPVASILTISAAGSESSDSAVITNEEKARKQGVNTPLNRPKFALMNPELTYTLPAYQIACGTADILMHTIERYFTRVQGNELSDRFALATIKNVMKNGKAMLENPSDYHAASELMWSGSISHNDLTGLGGLKSLDMHKLGHELSAMWDIAHGASLTTVWEAWGLYTLKYDEKRFQSFGTEVFGFDPELPGENTVFAMRDYFKNVLGLPTCFGETDFGVQDEAVIDDLALRCIVKPDAVFGSFMPLGHEDVKAIYSACNK